MYNTGKNLNKYDVSHIIELMDGRLTTYTYNMSNDTYEIYAHLRDGSRPLYRTFSGTIVDIVIITANGESSKNVSKTISAADYICSSSFIKYNDKLYSHLRYNLVLHKLLSDRGHSLNTIETALLALIEASEEEDSDKKEILISVERLKKCSNFNISMDGIRNCSDYIKRSKAISLVRHSRFSSILDEPMRSEDCSEIISAKEQRKMMFKSLNIMEDDDFDQTTEFSAKQVNSK